MAKKEKLILSPNDGQEHLKPYCKEAKVAAEHKTKAESLRVKATEELQAKLDSDPETKDFTGTVVCIYDDQIYKIRVQRPESCDWLSKRLNDPILREYKALMKDIERSTAHAKDLEQQLAEAHPKCITKGFVIGFLSK